MILVLDLFSWHYFKCFSKKYFFKAGFLSLHIFGKLIIYVRRKLKYNSSKENIFLQGRVHKSIQYSCTDQKCKILGVKCLLYNYCSLWCMPLWFMQVQALYPMCLVFLICNVEANVEEDNEEIQAPPQNICLLIEPNFDFD